jgi:hypothetical protein
MRFQPGRPSGDASGKDIGSAGFTEGRVDGS